MPWTRRFSAWSAGASFVASTGPIRPTRINRLTKRRPTVADYRQIVDALARLVFSLTDALGFQNVSVKLVPRRRPHRRKPPATGAAS
jgi:hypothetical protein